MKTISLSLLLMAVFLLLAGAAFGQDEPVASECQETGKSNLDVKPRRQIPDRYSAPTVGTGGSVGGPTGLFTVYDANILNKGEYTFTTAYSRFNRDPGNVTLNEIPLSFNLGLNKQVEFFFNTTAYRRVRVGNPQLLSSFYLPNTQFNLLANGGAALTLAPLNNSGVQGAVYRPAFGQPVIQFPFVGAQINGSMFLPQFGTATLGALSINRGVNFGAASSFPGIGSVYGSILPGIVFTTAPRPGAPPGTAQTIPLVSTLAPTYLPDAPFINRPVGQSSFSTMVVGAKFRLTGPARAIGVGIIPFYRFYLDNPNSSSGFQQLQRGASPGGTIGDFGFIGFAGLPLFSRATKDPDNSSNVVLSSELSVSANLGYILNSNPTSERFGTTRLSLLDRPDEFVYGVGVDYTHKFINAKRLRDSMLQAIAELRGTRYVGGRTPNAFEHNPLDLLVGARFFPKYNFGFGIAYRRHLNHQGNGGEINGLLNPSGFGPPSSANGLMVQFWIGFRKTSFSNSNEPSEPQRSNGRLPCRPGYIPSPGSCNEGKTEAIVDASHLLYKGRKPTIFDWTMQDEDKIKFTRTDGPIAYLDTTDLPAGKYFIKVYLGDESGEMHLPTSIEYLVCPCSTCTPAPCPDVTIEASVNSVSYGNTVQFTAQLKNLTSGVLPTYVWTVSEGTITQGQGTASITVDTNGVRATSVQAQLKVIVSGRECPIQTSTPVQVPISCPDIEIQPDVKTVNHNQLITFTATLSSVDPRVTQTYQWSVNGGSITQGQGTLTITVNTNGSSKQQVVATLDVGGYGKGCSGSASVPINTLFDKYGYICFNNEKARLDNFAIALNTEPRTTGYIIAYTGQLNTLDEAQNRADRARDYLVKSRGVDRSRIVVKAIKGGNSRYLRGELWIRPLGAPEPSGHLSPELIQGLEDINPDQERAECRRVKPSTKTRKLIKRSR